MLKTELHILGKKYADHYHGRYANAIITKNNIYWLDTNFSSYEFNKGLKEYLLNEGKETLLKSIRETLNEKDNIKWCMR